MIPGWLHILAIAALIAGAFSALAIAIDVGRDPQQMWIMNVVWPVVALFGGPLAIHGYFAYGKAKAQSRTGHGKQDGGKTPLPVAVAKGTCHCGSGCTLGDIAAEWLIFLVPAVAVWFGYGLLFQEKIFAAWVLDFVFAFAFGIAFQYFAIKPMRDISARQGLWQALKADALSLTAWQLGMYGFMALAHFWLFPSVIGAELKPVSVEFWFMMQIAMLCGFVTSYPVNWWLISNGIKERM